MHRIVLFFCLISIINSTTAQSPLQRAINELAADPDLKSGGFSMTVMDVATGEVLASYQKDHGLLPASSLKVVTTGIALDLLGADFRFKTELQYDGSIDAKGILNGNVYIKGYGDPTLGSDQFEKTIPLEDLMQDFVKAMQDAGIKKINGKIIGDASFFSSEANGRTWSWEDIGNYYGAGAWGLNIRENRYHLTFRQQSQLGKIPPIEKVEPEIPNLIHINEVRSAEKGSGDNAYIFGSNYNYTRFVRGTIPVGKSPFEIKGSIPDPPFFAAYSLLVASENAGIQSNKIATSLLELERAGDFKAGKRKTIYTHYSPILKEIVEITNMKSINLYCEALLRYLGKSQKGAGTPGAGLEVIDDYWEKKGIDNKGFFMEDGSGLSSFNVVSSYQLASYMRELALNKALYKVFLPSLPVAAKSGSLSYMFKNTAASGKIRAKSGGLKRVRSYTGYVEGQGGQLLSFSIICNRFTGESGALRRKMEKAMLPMVNGLK
jgi:D-alanyl-D-alanine carboxypeptidase/D-alanyl-D-alanine-endopeptidase (penicillin-binding protein 4)